MMLPSALLSAALVLTNASAFVGQQTMSVKRLSSLSAFGGLPPLHYENNYPNNSIPQPNNGQQPSLGPPPGIVNNKMPQIPNKNMIPQHLFSNANPNYPNNNMSKGQQQQQRQRVPGASANYLQGISNRENYSPLIPGAMPDKDLAELFAHNLAWRDEKLKEDPNFFDNLAVTHKPNYFWIGCSDARVPANEIIGEDAGSVFVVRNVANMVVNTDFNLMAALQYAVDVLHIPHIIVCGHYECGGVRASVERKDHVPPLENWLRNIRDVYRLHKDELNSIADPEARHRRLVELNVIEQCINLSKTGVVQRRRVETYKTKEDGEYTTPRIHACVFDPRTGYMTRLKVNFREYINDLHDVYDLYTVEEDEAKVALPHLGMS